jgi:cytochrome P450
MQDFSFSNGIRVPAGELVQAMMTPIHHDASLYPEPLEFKPWRFYELARADGPDVEVRTPNKYDMVTPSSTYLTWGLGRHAW